MTTHPNNPWLRLLCRVMAQHGISRIKMDHAAAARYTPCQDGDELFYEFAEQYEPTPPPKTEWRDKE